MSVIVPPAILGREMAAIYGCLACFLFMQEPSMPIKFPVWGGIFWGAGDGGGGGKSCG